MTEGTARVEEQAADIVASYMQARGQNTLRVGALLPVATEFITPILGAYRRGAPKVSLRLIDVADLGGDHALIDRQVDAAFLWTPVMWERLRTVPLFTDGLVALVGLDHPLAGAKALHPAELAEEYFTVSASMSDRWRHASILPLWREHPERAVWVHDPRRALDAIAHNRAVSIGPCSLARIEPVPGIAYVPLLVPHGPRALLATRHEERRPHVLALLAAAEYVSAQGLRGAMTSSGAGRARPGRYPTEAKHLSAREKQVLECMSTGATAQRVGHLLGISERTVHKHLENAYAKLGVNDRISAIAQFRALGYLP